VEILKSAYFSKSYADARQRFVQAATLAGAEMSTHRLSVDSPHELTIDVAIIGSAGAPTLVLSSGIHGVEGFLGSAIQLALLARLAQSNSTVTSESKIRYVLLHGLNPFGFANLRRVNEENVDLNRNFHQSVTDFAGAPEGYAELNNFLNPQSPPSPWEPFRVKAIWNIWRKGLQALKQAVAGGQYEFPRGLFFGGTGPCETTRIVQQYCDAWIGPSQHILHVDIHSGLGPFGSNKLLLNETIESPLHAWYARTFGAEHIEAQAEPASTAYQGSGLFGEWMQHHFHSRNYRFVTAEFGTHDVIRVLGALRAENRAHHYSSETSPQFRRAKTELLECFCPKDSAWREKAIGSGLVIIAQGTTALSPQAADAF
jgi:hypothetical protein